MVDDVRVAAFFKVLVLLKSSGFGFAKKSTWGCDAPWADLSIFEADVNFSAAFVSIFKVLLSEGDNLMAR